MKLISPGKVLEQAPGDELANRVVVIGPLPADGCQAVQDGRLGVLRSGNAQYPPRFLPLEIWSLRHRRRPPSPLPTASSTSPSWRFSALTNHISALATLTTTRRSFLTFCRNHSGGVATCQTLEVANLPAMDFKVVRPGALGARQRELAVASAGPPLSEYHSHTLPPSSQMNRFGNPVALASKLTASRSCGGLIELGRFLAQPGPGFQAEKFDNLARHTALNDRSSMESHRVQY